MTTGPLDVPTDGRARPQLDPLSRVFWEATTRDELLVQRCRTCGRHQFYPRHACAACGGPPGWVRASGRGTVHTFTVVRQNRTPPFADLVPYVVAMIELEEGARLMGNVVGVTPGDVRVGLPVVVHFVDWEPEHKLPVWEPVR